MNSQIGFFSGRSATKPPSKWGRIETSTVSKERQELIHMYITLRKTNTYNCHQICPKDACYILFLFCVVEMKAEEFVFDIVEMLEGAVKVFANGARLSEWRKCPEYFIDQLKSMFMFYLCSKWSDWRVCLCTIYVVNGIQVLERHIEILIPCRTRERANGTPEKEARTKAYGPETREETKKTNTRASPCEEDETPQQVWVEWHTNTSKMKEYAWFHEPKTRIIYLMLGIHM